MLEISLGDKINEENTRTKTQFIGINERVAKLKWQCLGQVVIQQRDRSTVKVLQRRPRETKKVAEKTGYSMYR